MQNALEGNKESYSKLVKITKKGSSSAKLVDNRNSKGEMLHDTDGAKYAWRDFFMELLGGEDMKQHNYDIEEKHTRLENTVERIYASKIRDINKNLNNGKAAGVV